METFARFQDEFEKANLGKYERIFPLPVKEAAQCYQNACYNTNMSKMEKDAAQQQYQALLRQQERYNQLLATVNNSEAEKIIR